MKCFEEIIMLNNNVKGIYRNIRSSSSTPSGILSRPSDLVGLRVSALLNTAAGLGNIWHTKNI